MARLIVKSPYISGSGVGGYLKYIGTREGVELLPAGYMEYMLERPRSHGLFGDEDCVDMNAVAQELNKYPGNIWTHIISLKREDAERLGYDHAAQWRNLIRTHRNEIAAAMNIPPSDFRWYAAFHDEGGHPHIHMMAWSAKPGQAYLSKDGIRKIKSVLTNDIFKQEMLHTYEQKSTSRDELVRKARGELKSLVQEMQTSTGSHPEVEALMMTLAAQLETVKGKKKYGYLPKTVKKTVDEIVNQLEQMPVIDECYQVWWELQCQIEDFYSEKERQRPPLSEQKEFRPIKNAVVQEAENILMGKVTFEDEEMEETTDSSNLSYDCWELWMVTQDDTAPMVDRDEAAAQLISKAEGGDPSAQYLVGKLYRDGPVLIPDSVESQYWFDQAARQDHVPAQYALSKLYLTDDAEVHDAKLGIQWLEYAAHHGSDCAAYCLGKEYLRGKVVERNTAKAMEYLTQSAEDGSKYTQYTLGKLYLDRQNREQAHYWFSQSAAQGNEYAQFFLDRWDSLKPPSVMLSVSRLLHHMGRIFQDQIPPLSIPGGIRIDRKRWYELYSKPNVRPSTAEYYRRSIEQHVVPRIGDIKLNRLTSRDIQKLYRDLQENGRLREVQRSKNPGLSNATVRGIHMMLHNALDRAVKERLILRNPTEDCIIPKLVKQEMKILYPEDMGSYLQAADKRDVLPMFYLELVSGLRKGELVALLWSDLDSESCTISVSKQAAVRNGEITVSRPKTETSVRRVSIPHEAVELLMREHKKHPDNPYMFPSPKSGGMYYPDSIVNLHKKILKDAGLEHIRFHDLRHTFATMALQSGVDVKTVSTMLGHYDAGFTLRTYTHATRQQQNRAAETMGNFMAQVM